jgi:hypothetical protein
MPTVAIGWRKNKKYAIRNAAAVQYCSLLYKKESELSQRKFRDKGLILLLRRFMSASRIGCTMRLVSPDLLCADFCTQCPMRRQTAHSCQCSPIGEGVGNDTIDGGEVDSTQRKCKMIDRADDSERSRSGEEEA